MSITEEGVGDIVVLRLSGRMTVETFGSVKEAVRAHVDLPGKRARVAIIRARCLI